MTGASVWTATTMRAARQVLRGPVTQAGFTAEYIPRGFLRHHPVLISDGDTHDDQRRALGRLFTRDVVRARYESHMRDAVARWLDDVPAGAVVRADRLALHYAVDVTRRVVGLTESSVTGMSRRLEAFFRQPPLDMTRDDLGRTRRQWAQAALNGLVPIAMFQLADVAPAVRARRRTPREDVVSHLIDRGYTDADILVECVTYGTAGMVTTREFIALALWRLLDDPALRERYDEADRAGRLALLYAIIRDEPVVEHLYRRVREPVTVDGAGELAPGTLVDIDVGATNADDAERAAGEAGLSFGAGPHRCPGQHLAMMETEVLLTALLRRRPVAVTAPRILWHDLVAGYQVREFDVRLEA
ncbi:cytochrome P450 [Tessaracoccus lacteus]|uniref:Cytochrome P450 n=1 Tax=Tessaracoccus lacteus TaxID=3041766 RepID=A0ABY8PZS6_9ACTN|nr:cytochrome P450 [Tessaracoccus sp. T21]WGT47677.1 cytochrome P450 [Tessaracoccus sp. T21]